MNIYVGNLAQSTTEDQLKNLFTEFGEVKSVKIITETGTRESKGYGFVDMPGNANAQKAILGLHEKPLNTKNLVVNEARNRENNNGSRKRW